MNKANTARSSRTKYNCIARTIPRNHHIHLRLLSLFFILSSLAGPANEDRMKNKENSRKWMWWFLGIVLAMQLYFVRELLAVFALFILGFGAIAFVVVALYLLHQGWAV